MTTTGSTLPRFAIVLTTVAADTDAAALARTLVRERLVACVSVLPPMQSVYRWQGTVEEAAERQLIMKTAVDRIDALKGRIATLHPYAVPEILVIDVGDGGQPYLEWLLASTRAGDETHEGV